MKLVEKFNISEKKQNALKLKMKTLGIKPGDIQEKFTRGSGKGGQKINKTSNKVVLLHVPTDLRATSQRERDRNKNRFIALRDLVNKIEAKISTHKSKEASIIERKKKQKARRHKKAKDKLIEKLLISDS